MRGRSLLFPRCDYRTEEPSAPDPSKAKPGRCNYHDEFYRRWSKSKTGSCIFAKAGRFQLLRQRMKSRSKPAVPEESLRFFGTDPDALSQALSTVAPPIKVERVANQAMSFECELVSAGPLSFGFCTYKGDFWCKRESDSGKFVVFFPLQGNASFKRGNETFESTPGNGLIADGTADSNVRFVGPRQHLVMIIEQKEMINRLRGMLETPARGPIDFNPSIDLTSGSGLMLKDLAEATFSGLARDAALRQSPLALSNLTNAITSLLLETVPHRFSDELGRAAPSPSPRHVKRAVAFMQANLSRPISLDDIAAACNVGVRSLQKWFRDFKMTTPMAYLQHLRLEAAHRELQLASPGLTIAAIAPKWGFGHAGRFAAEYKLRFGQSPSQTLRG